MAGNLRYIGGGTYNVNDKHTMTHTMNKFTKPRQDYGKGFCGIGIYMPKTKENIGTLVRSAKMFEADFVFMIGERYVSQCSAVHLDEKIPIFYFKDFATFREVMPPVEHYTVIELTERSKPLQEYTHPRKGIYILGAEDHGVSKEILESDRCAFVEIEGNSSLNVAVETIQINMERQNIGLARDHAEIAQHKIEDVLLLITSNSN